MHIPFSPPDISPIEIEHVVSVLKSGWITTGPATKLLEKRVAEYCGTPRAACLNSATAALELTLRVLGIGAGDEVITSAYTYTASASVIEHVGAKIVLCDTAPDSYEMDYAALATKITARTKAIIAVDIAGIVCDYGAIINAADSKRCLFKAANSMQKALGRAAIIADAAHSFGAERQGEKSGGLADFTCFSFHAVKNLTTAEGGAVVWKNTSGVDNDVLYREYMLWSLHGQSKDALAKTTLGAWEYDIEKLGYKYNMTDTLAAIGLAQLDRYDALLQRRKDIVLTYDKGFAKTKIKVPAHYTSNSASSGHLYLTRVEGINEAHRSRIITALAAQGIACNVHYKPLPLFSAYKALGFDIKHYPNAFKQYQNQISLPLHTLLTNEEAAYIIKTYKEIVATC